MNVRISLSEERLDAGRLVRVLLVGAERRLALQQERAAVDALEGLSIVRPTARPTRGEAAATDYEETCR
jgi:hypothetical protein